MKTLLIAPQVPWPLDAGSKIRVDQLLRCYAQLGEVTFACFVQDAGEAAGVAELERFCARVVCFDFASETRTRRVFGGKAGAIVQVLDPRPWMVRFFHCPEVARKIEALLSSDEFDLVHIERLSMAQFAGNVFSRRHGNRPYLIIDIDDLESGKMIRAAALDPWCSLRRYLRLLDWLKLLTYERSVLPKFDRALVCSEKDQRRLQRRHKNPIIEVFRNGAEFDEGATGNGTEDDGRTLVYIGAMGYPPNEDAALFFATSILPLIRADVPDVRFIIAGKSPSEKVRSLADGRNVVVTGYVEDKAVLLRSCTVFVVPLRLGGGTRIKILEVMAAGKPIVSTGVGCEGIDVTPEENILVADRPAEFAAACVELLRDKSRRQSLGRAGRELVQRGYRWSQIRSGYVERLRDWVCGAAVTRSRD